MSDLTPTMRAAEDAWIAWGAAIVGRDSLARIIADALVDEEPGLDKARRAVTLRAQYSDARALEIDRHHAYDAAVAADQAARRAGG